MRVTNSMISNSARSHISSAKNKLLTAEEQYTSEKKIQRPSDDPTIAVRSLRYRSTLSQIKQYLEKNVQDAMSWMEATETAMKNINSILENMKGTMNQGANDYLALDERNDVLSKLQQYVNAIFQDEANSDFSGRYIFAGYRTDTSLLFDKRTTNLSYDITENFDYSQVSSVNVVTGKVAYDPNADAQEYADMLSGEGTYPGVRKSSVYRIQLAYKNCAAAGPLADPNSTWPAGYTFDAKDANGQSVLGGTQTLTTKASTEEDAYDDLDPDEVRYIYDTGEILMGENIYQKIQENRASVSIQYSKTEFDKYDIRPEMYFQCNAYDSISQRTFNYADPSGQDINYEINFSQMMTVNTQGKDAISTEIYRLMDYLTQTVREVDDVENRIAEAKKMLSNATDDTDKKNLSQLIESLESERSLRVTVMTEAFGMGLSMIDRAQETLNVATASLGTRYNRLQLTYDKLSDQQIDTEAQLSNNEDIDIADAFINMTQADNLYMYALSATSKILGNTLLDYI